MNKNVYSEYSFILIFSILTVGSARGAEPPEHEKPSVPAPAPEALDTKQRHETSGRTLFSLLSADRQRTQFTDSIIDKFITEVRGQVTSDAQCGEAPTVMQYVFGLTGLQRRSFGEELVTYLKDDAISEEQRKFAKAFAAGTLSYLGKWDKKDNWMRLKNLAKDWELCGKAYKAEIDKKYKSSFEKYNATLQYVKVVNGDCYLDKRFLERFRKAFENKKIPLAFIEGLLSKDKVSKIERDYVERLLCSKMVEDGKGRVFMPVESTKKQTSSNKTSKPSLVRMGSANKEGLINVEQIVNSFSRWNEKSAQPDGKKISRAHEHNYPEVIESVKDYRPTKEKLIHVWHDVGNGVYKPTTVSIDSRDDIVSFNAPPERKPLFSHWGYVDLSHMRNSHERNETRKVFEWLNEQIEKKTGNRPFTFEDDGTGKPVPIHIYSHRSLVNGFIGQGWGERRRVGKNGKRAISECSIIVRTSKFYENKNPQERLVPLISHELNHCFGYRVGRSIHSPYSGSLMYRAVGLLSNYSAKAVDDHVSFINQSIENELKKINGIGSPAHLAENTNATSGFRTAGLSSRSTSYSRHYGASTRRRSPRFRVFPRFGGR